MKKKLKRFITNFLGREENYDYLSKRNNLKIAISFVVANNIEGDYLEFGVFKGASFIYAYKELNEAFNKYKKSFENKAEDSFIHQKIKFYAFDSFEGLPENTDQDIPLHWTGEKPMSYPRHLFQNNLIEGKVNLDDVRIIEGFYDKTLNLSLYEKHNLRKAAIIHIDCDLYESTKTVLDTIRPLIVDGTVIVFDDYFYYKGHPNKGERGAFNEWLIQNPDLVASELCKYYPSAAYIVNFV